MMPVIEQEAIIDLPTIPRGGFPQSFIDRRWAEWRDGFESCDALIVPHSETCPRVTGRVDGDPIYCYVSDCLRNPYPVRVNGRDRQLYVPWCCASWPGGHIRNAMDALGSHIGREIISSDDPAPDRWSRRLITGHALESAWRDGVKHAEPIIVGGGYRKFNYIFERDVLAHVAKSMPRQKCVCGRRLQRGLSPDPDGTHTYLLLDKPFVKIGKTTRRLGRWRQSKTVNGLKVVRATDNPRPLTVLGMLCGDLEQSLQSRFEDVRVEGEWFKDIPEIRQEFRVRVVGQSLQSRLPI